MGAGNEGTLTPEEQAELSDLVARYEHLKHECHEGTKGTNWVGMTGQLA